jgi:hypothetical protein
MSGKWPGGFITKTAPTVVGPVDGEGGSASGVWTLDQVADYVKQGLWPSPVQVGSLITWSQTCLRRRIYSCYKNRWNSLCLGVWNYAGQLGHWQHRLTTLLQYRLEHLLRGRKLLRETVIL